ncbi:MAG: DNA polymerase I [Anaerolineales bacterium]|nr:MAG: DNA polymerase I [Anaerolineales bacterium]
MVNKPEAAQDASKKQTLVLIDGHALAYRAYFALSNTGFRTRDGEPTHAVYGFALMLLAVWEEHDPDYLAVAFDLGDTFRHKQYAEYKATREKMPDDLGLQLGRIEEVVRAFNIPIFTAENFEADDVLGTLSRQARERDVETIIVTGDRDAFQLVGPGVKVLISGRSFSDRELYDEAGVEERYGLPPAKLVELKGLMGDTSDNIPGVKGVGEKGGVKLLQEYGSLEGIYEHLDELPKSQRAKLDAARDMAYLSRALGRIVTDVPGVKLDLESCRTHDFDREEALRLFRELEFRSLYNRVPGREAPPLAAPSAVGGVQLSMFKEGAPAAETAVVSISEADYQIVVTRDALAELVDRLKGSSRFTFDVETTSTDAIIADLVGIALTDAPGRGYYIPVSRLPSLISMLQPLFADSTLEKIAHNAKYDITVLAQHGLETQGPLFDTMIASWLINPSGNHGLKNLAWARLGVEMTEITELIGSGKNQITMAQVPVEQVAPYACADVDMTTRLVDDLTGELKTRGLWPLFSEVEMPLVPVLTDMERFGIRLDVQVLREMSKQLEERLRGIEVEIQDLVGYNFNVNSTQQLSDALFVKLALPTVGLKKTKSGHYSTAASVLERLQGYHEVIDMILEQRQLTKLKSTYVDALPQLINPRSGRIHTSFNQTGTVTGRISSSNPNLQNIPIRTQLGREVRRAFVADDGWKLVAADYSQVELRLMAHIAQDPGLLSAFERGEDIHVATAAAVLDIPLTEVTKDQRRIAKSVNFGLSYGQSAYGLAQQTGMSQQEAGQFIKTYFEKYPGVREYIERTKHQAAEQGYVETLLGRRRDFFNLAKMRGPDRGRAEREAINMPIQGTAADIIKIAMIRLHQALRQRKLRTRLLLQVHDELVLEAPDDEVEAVIPLVREMMSNAFPSRAPGGELAVPLRVDVEVGQNWLEMEGR